MKILTSLILTSAAVGGLLNPVWNLPNQRMINMQKAYAKVVTAPEGSIEQGFEIIKMDSLIKQNLLFEIGATKQDNFLGRYDLNFKYKY